MTVSNKLFFDAMAPQWDRHLQINPQKILHILDVAEIAENDYVLDVGTGTGVLVPFLSRRVGSAGHITGLDISEGMLMRARFKFSGLKNVSFLQADIEEQTLPGKYGHIMMYCMFPHLHNQIDTLEWLAKVNLLPGGTLTIAHPCGRETINSLHHHRDGSVHSIPLQPAEELRRILRHRGIAVSYIEDTPESYILTIKA